MDTISRNTNIANIYHGRSISYIANITLPLPDADTVVNDSYDMAYPQIVAWGTAASGILLVVLLVKAFANK